MLKVLLLATFQGRSHLTRKCACVCVCVHCLADLIFCVSPNPKRLSPRQCLAQHNGNICRYVCKHNNTYNINNTHVSVCRCVLVCYSRIGQSLVWKETLCFRKLSKKVSTRTHTHTYTTVVEYKLLLRAHHRHTHTYIYTHMLISTCGKKLKRCCINFVFCA